ncbi:MAG: PH domain-containing protein [Hyphomicrobiaceae bacterium]|nr:PH domain-containing protein [Hyphomicrobiaceae bacterium]
MSDDFEIEPVPGLPAKLPPGESILWQGAPATMTLARRAFHLDIVLAYFALLATWSIASGAADGEAAMAIAGDVARISGVAAIAAGVIVFLAWANCRATIYTITTKRVVMRYGIALPMSVNIPFRYIVNADLKVHGNETGDIAMQLTGDRFLGFVHLWPHVRAWRLAKPEPVLRSLDDVKAVAGILTQALADAAGQDVPRSEAATAPAETATQQRRPASRPERDGMPSGAVAA